MKTGIMRARRAGLVVAAVALVAVLLLAACGQAAPSGGAEKVVRLGFVAGLTGPASAPSQYAFRGVDNYVKYFNEEVGLPDGGKVKLEWVDTAYQLSRGMSTYHRWAEEGMPLFISVLMQETISQKPLAKKEGLPYVSMASSEPAIYPPAWGVYAESPPDAERFAIWCDWIMENWHEDRPPKVVFVGADMPFCRDPEIQGTKYAESIGIEMLPMIIVPYVPTDTTVQMMRLQELGADFAYITSVWSTALPVMKDAERMGLIGKVQFGGYENSQSKALIEQLGTAADGYTSPRTVPYAEEVDIPGIKLQRDLEIKYQGKPDYQGDEAHQLRSASVACEALSRAVEKVGYGNVDGATVVEVLDSMKDFDPYGVGSITYTPDDHRGALKVCVYEIRNGKVVPLGDWKQVPSLRPE